MLDYELIICRHCRCLFWFAELQTFAKYPSSLEL